MKSSVLILSLFVCTGLNAQKKYLNICRWHYSDNVEASDYQLIRKANLYYSLSNDNDNIYIDMKIEDPEVQNSILKDGLIIWINMDGKPLKKIGVRYPIGSQNPGVRNKPALSENGSNPDRTRGTSLSLATTIGLIGFTGEQERHFPSDNADNFRGSVKYDEAGKLHYKMIMPIAKLPVRNSKEGNGAMPFNLGIEYGFSGANRSDKNGRMSSENAGRNPKSQKMTAGSELYWIKEVRLATSK